MSALLATHDLRIGYQRRRQPESVIAERLTLALHPGELVCLLGPNGAGKSTLMRTLAAMQRPLGGRITLTDADLHTLSPRQLAQRLSIVLTDRPDLGLLNGYALVALGRYPHTDWTGGLTAHDEQVVQWAVEAVGAGDLATRPLMTLSDGQRQKLMIARALAQESSIILLDEPTAYLDLPRRVEVMQLLRHLASATGRAILVSTHDLDLALRSADVFWLMSGGTVEVGAPEDLVLNGAFERIFASEGVTFDRSTGAFRVVQAAQGRVRLEGAGLVRAWTQRALERAGLQADDSAAVVIRCGGAAEAPVWHVEGAGAPATCSTIRELVARVRQKRTPLSGREGQLSGREGRR